MKLEKLTIHNIASIEDAEIDFSSSPLADADVFLISGKTGAGKTTILDAITLALYGNVPRLQNTLMEGNVKEGGEEITLKNPGQLLRKNTGEGFVSLTFKGNNGLSYEAKWSLSRARNKPDGRLQQRVWTLLKEGERSPFTRAVDIKDEIERAIGLDFTQFCRTTVLAQGEFSKFLNSEDKDKTAILEKITGTHIYSLIGQKIYQICSEKKAEWNEAESKLKGVRLLSEDEKNNIAGEILQLENSCNDLEKEMKTNSQILNLIDTISQEEKRINACYETLENYKNDYVRCIGGIEYQNLLKRNLEEKLKEEEKFFTSQQSRLNTILNSKVIIRLLAFLTGGTDYIKEESRKIEEEKYQLKEILEVQYQKAVNIHQEAKKLTSEKRIQKSLKEKEFESLNLKSLREIKELTVKKETLLTLIKDKVENTRERLVKLNQVQAQLYEREREIVDLKEKKASGERALVGASEAERIARDIYDGQKDSVNEYVVRLRAQLHEGDRCPVCRQEILHQPEAEEVIRALVEKCRIKLEQARAEKERIQKLISESEGKLQTLGSQKIKLSEELIKEIEAIEIKKQTIITECKEVSITVDTIKLDSEADYREFENEIKNICLKIEEEKRNIEQKIRYAEERELELINLRKQYEEAAENEKKIEKTVLSLEHNINEKKESIKIKESNIVSKQKEIETTKSEIEKMIEGEWEEDWKETPGEYCKLLETTAETYNSHTVEKQRLEKELRELSVDIIHNKENVEIVENKLPEWQAVNATPMKVENLSQKFNHLIVGLAETLNACKASDLRKEESEKLLKQIVAEPEEREKLRKDRDAVSRKLEEINSLLKEKIQTRGALSQKLENDKKNQDLMLQLSEEAEKRKKIYAGWEELNQYLGSSKGDKFRKVAQSYMLVNMLDGANHYLNLLSGRYRLKAIEGTFVICVEDAFQGGAIRAANTLSGGETFLVSLALALALSDLGGRLGVDTLFIDEGFGSLSGESLQRAVDTLRSLHGKTGRHVGIISHVEELQEKIPVQIRVESQGFSSASRVQVVYPA